jgi:Zn-dependent protease with chaperone function
MAQLQTQPETALPVNDLAAAYQPRRVWAAAIMIGWNLLLAGIFVAGQVATRLYHLLTLYVGAGHHAITVPLFLVLFFAAYAVMNYPLELWFGYLEERQFGLAKEGIRAWTRDWLSGIAHHGVMFLLGCGLLMALQVTMPATWLLWTSLSLLALFLLTSFLELPLLPRALFQVEAIDPDAERRLRELIPAHPGKLPAMLVYSSPNLRDFAGGLVGLGNRQVWLVSRSTLSGASDELLRFVLLHDLGHRRYHHLLLSTLAGWAWAVLGLCASHAVILRASPASVGHAPYLAWLALCLSTWMALGEPLLAYLGRRLEYQADRYYLRHGGTVEHMRSALEELSRRNLARTETLRRRNTIFHPLPSVWNRLHAAGVYAAKLAGSRRRG